MTVGPGIPQNQLLQNLSAGAPQSQTAQARTAVDETIQWFGDNEKLDWIKQEARKQDPKRVLEEQYTRQDYATRMGVWNQITQAVTQNLGLSFSLGILNSAYQDVQSYVAELEGAFGGEIPASIQALISGAYSLMDTVAGFLEIVLPKEASINRREAHALLGGDYDKQSQKNSPNGKAFASSDNGLVKMSAAGALNNGAVSLIGSIKELLEAAKSDPQRANFYLTSAGQFLSQAAALNDFMSGAAGANAPALGAEISRLQNELEAFIPDKNPFSLRQTG